jgi:hypothetical protein
MVKTILDADTSSGPKYVLFVTDGEPDFCDDSNAVCSIDAVVYELQSLKLGGVSTFVFGLDSRLSTVSGAALQAFANAGAGQGVDPVVTVGPGQQEIYFECQTQADWKSYYTAAGKTTQIEAAGSYAGGGTATVYHPDPTQQQALTNLVASTVAGVKSCLFDLAPGLTVDLAKLTGATVSIDGQSIPQDAQSGWGMASPTRLVLNGGACNLWRTPNARAIDFQFPCGTVISSH